MEYYHREELIFINNANIQEIYKLYKKSDIISEKYYIDKVLNIIYVIVRHIQVMKLKKKKYIK